MSDYFILSPYKDKFGKENQCYLVTKLGCDFLTNKFTGESEEEKLKLKLFGKDPLEVASAHNRLVELEVEKTLVFSYSTGCRRGEARQLLKEVVVYEPKEKEITIIDEEPWFVGKDIAIALGYSNASKTLNDHVDKEDKLNNISLSSLGQRGGWLINET